MARPLRIEYPGAIYHVMARGNHRQDIVQDDHDHQELVERLELTVERYGWLMYAFVMLTNHLHLLFCTPDANLSAGMQFYLSGYANWFQRRHGHIGHLFQGRFRGYIIEDESYFWNVSRYDHLNPLRTHPPLAAHPSDWRWSSYPGYPDRRQRLDWVAYDRLLAVREANYYDTAVDEIRRFRSRDFARSVRAAFHLCA